MSIQKHVWTCRDEMFHLARICVSLVPVAKSFALPQGLITTLSGDIIIFAWPRVDGSVSAGDNPLLASCHLLPSFI